LVAAGAISVTATAFGAFQCTGALPQIVDFGSAATLTSDDIVAICDSQLIGASVVKVSPQQFAVRSDNFAVGGTLAVFTTIGSIQGFFTAGISTGIQPHVGFQSSGSLHGGFAKVQTIVGETYPSSYYPRRGYLKIGSVNTNVVDQADEPAITEAATVTSYPVGLQEMQITGRNLGNVFRVYNTDAAAPFAGFARGTGSLKPSLQSTVAGGGLSSNVGLRLEDLPFGSSEKLVVEMNQDAVAGTSAVPLYKKANIWTMDPVNGGQGSIIKFTLTDPEDNNLYFFDPASPFRDFDFSDFNILFKSAGLHHIYPENTGTKLPNFSAKSTLLFQSKEFGPAYRPCLSLVYGNVPNKSAVQVSHTTYVKNQVSYCHVYATLPTGAIRGTFSGGYVITPANYTGNGGAALVELTITASSGDINTGGTAFVVGDILVVGGTGDYVGAYLITSASTSTVKAVAPGIRKTSYAPIVLDTALNPLSGVQKSPIAMTDLAAALNNYLADNPVVSGRVITSDPTVQVLYPTYFTQGDAVADTSLTSMSASFSKHSAFGHYGSLASVFIYRRLDETNTVVDEIRALSQYHDAILLSSSEIEPAMNYIYRGEECLLVPANSVSLSRWLSFASVSSLPLRAEVALVDSMSTVQINSRERGSSGAVQVSGITANAVSDTLKSVPSQSEAGFMKANVSYVLAQAMPRGTLVEVTNDFAVTCGRAYTSQAVSGTSSLYSVITASNDARPDVFFRDTTVVSYERPTPSVGRFIFKRSASGFVVSGVNNVRITKINTFVARLSVPVGSTNTLRARLGDMCVISAASSALSANKCAALSDAANSDVYTGYPVVHVASDTEIYVLAPNMIDDLFTLSSADDVVFVPHIKHEKNIRTNYKSGAQLRTLIASGEALYYRLKTIGGGFVYCEFSNDTDGTALDMQLDGLSVSTDDWVSFSPAFLPANRGTFRIVAHNGVNAIVFKNDEAVDEVLNSKTYTTDTYGTSYWGMGPIGDSTFPVGQVDKRHVRIWDADSVFESDSLVISPAVTSSASWFPSSLIGTWTIKNIGLTGSSHTKGSYQVYVDVAIPNAPATGTVADILLSSSASSVSFQERAVSAGSSRVVGYKWVSGYAPSSVNTEYADVYLAPSTSIRKILPEYGSKITALYKTSYPTGTQTGVDAYQYYTELIAEAHKVLDGSSENPIDYPGVRAAGSQVEVLAPLIKSVYLTLDITPREGVTISSIKAPVRSVVSSYINGLGVGREVVKSEIIKRTQQVPGVKSVTVVSTTPTSTNGTVSVGSFEVARILDPNNISI